MIVTTELFRNVGGWFIKNWISYSSTLQYSKSSQYTVMDHHPESPKKLTRDAQQKKTKKNMSDMSMADSLVDSTLW